MAEPQALAAALGLEPQPGQAAALERGKIYSELEALTRGEDPMAAALAEACIAPLAEVVLAADEAIVSAEEWQRASLLMGELYAVEPLEVGLDWIRNAERRAPIIWGSARNAYAVAAGRDGKRTANQSALACDF